MTFAAIAAVFLALALWVASRIRRRLRWADNDVLTAVKDAVNGVFLKAEARGAIRRIPGFWTDYGDEYPALRRLEAGYDDVRAECLHLLGAPQRNRGYRRFQEAARHAVPLRVARSPHAAHVSISPLRRRTRRRI